jgi:hypothetical protein
LQTNSIEKIKGEKMNLLTENRKLVTALFLMAAAFLGTSFTQAQETRDVSKYNLFVPGENLNGYDPVGYFPEGGGKPQMGLKDLSMTYMGVTYNFSTAQNLETFLQNPNKYEPTYGQWCARAMAVGQYIKINPLIYTVHGNRLHFFVSKRAKDFFDADLEALEASADNFWKQISGEEPRF